MSTRITKPSLPPLEINENCSFCEQTKRDMESLERRFQGWAQTLQDKQRILDIAINFMVKEPELLVDRVLEKFRAEKK